MEFVLDPALPAGAAQGDDRFRALFDHASDALMLLDDQACYVEVNDAACALLETPRDRLVGARVATWLPADGAEIEALWETLRRTGRLTGEHSWVLQDRSHRVVEYTVRANVRPGEHLATVRDIGERRRLELQLLQAQKMESVGRLAGGIAHDFNNLLTAILGYAHLVEDLLVPGAPGHREIGQICGAADRAATLTRQLLAFSRKQVLQARAFSLNGSVTGLEGMLRRIISEDIELQATLDPRLPQVKADPSQIEQVILNLVVNARDAMPEGGRLEIRTDQTRIDREFGGGEFAVVPGNYVRLSVRDTGVGMSEEVRRRAFEPFFTTKPVGQGTGLGLSTVYGIVKQSGGYLRILSAPGDGCTIEMYLPPAAGRGDEPSPARAPRLPFGEGRETVLVVEDEDAVRQLVCEVLRRQGYTVLQAPNAEEALAICARVEGRIALLVTDLVMPGMRGTQLARVIAERYPDVKVLYMSGHNLADRARELVLEPAHPFLQKPFTPDVLSRRVRRVLDE